VLAVLNASVEGNIDQREREREAEEAALGNLVSTSVAGLCDCRALALVDASLWKGTYIDQREAALGN